MRYRITYTLDGREYSTIYDAEPIGPLSAADVALLKCACRFQRATGLRAEAVEE